MNNYKDHIVHYNKLCDLAIVVSILQLFITFFTMFIVFWKLCISFGNKPAD